MEGAFVIHSNHTTSDPGLLSRGTYNTFGGIMKKIIVAIIATTAVLFATSACEVPEEDNEPGAQRATTGAKAKDSEKQPAKEKDEGPQETTSQANARAKAEEYLDYSSFSRQGLIDQLKFEGFNAKDATYGADAVNANWNEQAVKKANEYLDMTAYSRAGLIDQLEFEGFTPAQAAYGVKKVGL